MKRVSLTIKEFYLFKEVAKFFFEATYSRNTVVVQADAKMLESLGY